MTNSSVLMTTRRPPKSWIDVWLPRMQLATGIIVSAATIYISYQAQALTNRTQETTSKLTQIEQQLAETKFGFERVKDIYDRTEKYLSSDQQDAPRGRVLVVLINSLPDSAMRAELLAVVTQKSLLPEVAAAAANSSINPNPAEIPPIFSATPQNVSNRFSGILQVSINKDGYGAVILNELQYTDKRGRTWTVPKGTVFDGAAIPRMVWSLVGGPLESDYKLPAIFLDYYANTRAASVEDTYNMFCDALTDAGVSAAKTALLCNAVRTLGPRWSAT